MSKTVKIPDCMSPFIVKVNGVKHVFPAGETVEVPDDVAHVIEQHQAYHDAIAKVNSGEANPGGGGNAADVAFLDLKKTITEYRDDTIVKLPECAFCGCTNLKMVVLPKVEDVHEQELFEDCPNLAVVDFTALKVLGEERYDNQEFGNFIPMQSIARSARALVNRGGLFQMGGKYTENDDFYISASCGLSLYLFDDLYIYVPRSCISEENFRRTIVEEDYFIYDGTGYQSAWGYDWWDWYEAGRIRAIEDYTVDGTVTGALDLAKMGIE